MRGNWSVVCIHLLDHTTLPVRDINARFPDTVWQLAVLTPFRNGDLTFGDLDLDPQGHPVKRVQLALENPEV